MDPGTRVRLERLARHGELAADPDEAALVVAFARRALGHLKWIVALMAVLLVLNLASAALAEDRTVQWLRIAVSALAVVAIAIYLFRYRPQLIRAETRNRELLPGSGGTTVRGPESSQPLPPLLVFDGDDLGVYRDVRAAENHLEPIDVSAGIYEGFDSLARPIRIELEKKRTKIFLAEEEAHSSPELERRLRRYLEYYKEPGSSNPDCDLPCLIDLAERYATR